MYYGILWLLAAAVIDISPDFLCRSFEVFLGEIRDMESRCIMVDGMIGRDGWHNLYEGHNLDERCKLLRRLIMVGKNAQLIRYRCSKHGFTYVIGRLVACSERKGLQAACFD